MFTYSLTLGSTAFPLPFLMVSSVDHITGVTGVQPTVAVSKNGGAFMPVAGVVTQIGQGWYVVAGNLNDTNTLGPLILHAEAPGADPVDAMFVVVAVNPQVAGNMGIGALPTAAPGATAGLPVNPITVGSVTGSVGSVVAPVTASAVTAPVTASTVTGDILGSVASVVDRTGFALAPAGLDLIDTTPEAGAASTFRGMLLQVYRRFFRAAAKSKGTGMIQTFADDGFTVLTTQPFTDDGAGNETMGAAS
jgi:hypothetical protein